MKELLGLVDEETEEEKRERMMFDKDYQATYHQNDGEPMGDVIAVGYGKAKTSNQLDLQRFQKKPIS